ncbi:MAG: hypothetical protein AABN33_06605 [Acidobacteriota bacterium]
MLVQQNYLGAVLGNYRCLFFLLEDCVEEQTQPMRELNLLLERFARTQKKSGALVRPFAADVEQPGKEILGKDRTPEQHGQLDKHRACS